MQMICAGLKDDLHEQSRRHHCSHFRVPDQSSEWGVGGKDRWQGSPKKSAQMNSGVHYYYCCCRTVPAAAGPAVAVAAVVGHCAILSIHCCCCLRCTGGA